VEIRVVENECSAKWWWPPERSTSDLSEKMYPREKSKKSSFAEAIAETFHRGQFPGRDGDEVSRRSPSGSIGEDRHPFTGSENLDAALGWNLRQPPERVLGDAMASKSGVERGGLREIDPLARLSMSVLVVEGDEGRHVRTFAGWVDRSRKYHRGIEAGPLSGLAPLKSHGKDGLERSKEPRPLVRSAGRKDADELPRHRSSPVACLTWRNLRALASRPEGAGITPGWRLGNPSRLD